MSNFLSARRPNTRATDSSAAAAAAAAKKKFARCKTVRWPNFEKFARVRQVEINQLALRCAVQWLCYTVFVCVCVSVRVGGGVASSSVCVRAAGRARHSSSSTFSPCSLLNSSRLGSTLGAVLAQGERGAAARARANSTTTELNRSRARSADRLTHQRRAGPGGAVGRRRRHGACARPRPSRKWPLRARPAQHELFPAPAGCSCAILVAAGPLLRVCARERRRAAT